MYTTTEDTEVQLFSILGVNNHKGYTLLFLSIDFLRILEGL